MAVSVRTTVVHIPEMLQDASTAVTTSRAAASRGPGEWPQWAGPALEMGRRLHQKRVAHISRIVIDAVVQALAGQFAEGLQSSL